MYVRPVSELYTPPRGRIIEDAPLDEHYENWGYSIAYELDRKEEPVPKGGNTAIFRIRPGGMTEPVIVTARTKDAKFSVKVLQGAGKLIRASLGDIFEEVPLSAGDETVIGPHDAYAYVNTSAKDDLLLHDVATPAFKPHHEVPIFSSRYFEDHKIKTHPDYSYSVAKSPLSEKYRGVPVLTQFCDAIGEAAAGRLVQRP